MDIENEENGGEEHKNLPWYRDPDRLHPFGLWKKLVIGDIEPDVLQTLTFFPWDYQSLSSLWEGSLATEENNTKWKDIINKFHDSIIICADREIYIFWLKKRKHPLKIEIPEMSENKLIQPDKTYAAWVLSPNAIDEPCVIFSRGSLIWIYNPIHRGISSYLRGHGGAITCLAVHPLVPNLFCSTSRDHTTRIYDLTLRPHKGFEDPDVNPHWPPGTLPSRAGAPHGLHMNESEGFGIGRCIIVLLGGRSGGHEAAVLNACFHPTYPILATCGIDRRVKLWHIHPRNSKQITREDKPLFSSSRLHRSRVLSIRWITHDILMSHCASAVMRTDPHNQENKDTYLVPGEIVVWKWLGLDRFFPPRYDEMRLEGKPQSVLRGCASDYQESSSFTMLANGSFPDCRLQLISPSVDLYQSPTHDPVATCVIPAGIPYWKKLRGKGRQGPSKEAPAKTRNTGSRFTEAGGSGQASAFLPPDEPPVLTKKLQNGSVQKFAGRVTFLHLPSMPQRSPPRFPLDETPNSNPGTPTEAADSTPKLSGLSTINPSLIERDPPPPITGWTLQIPLDDQDLIYESLDASVGNDGEDGDAMQVDENNQVKGSSKRHKAKKPVENKKPLDEQPIAVRIQTAGMGMGGNVVVILGTRGRVWVYRKNVRVEN